MVSFGGPLRSVVSYGKTGVLRTYSNLLPKSEGPFGETTTFRETFYSSKVGRNLA